MTVGVNENLCIGSNGFGIDHEIHRLDAMVRAGLFKDVDVTLYWHHWPRKRNFAAVFAIDVGAQSSHAAVAPDRGRSALGGGKVYIATQPRHERQSCAKVGHSTDISVWLRLRVSAFAKIVRTDRAVSPTSDWHTSVTEIDSMQKYYEAPR